MEKYNLINLPTYDDDEVKVFHPICEFALDEALRRSDLANTFKVEHHVYIGSVCADFAVVRKATGKYLLFIEVKRTPSSVTSSSSRSQAHFYVTEAGDRSENGYYAVTNLEILDLFKYSISRSSVLNQILEPSPIRIGSFEDDPNSFITHLIKKFQEVVDLSLSNYEIYRQSTTRLLPLLEERKNDINRWHTALMVTGYEYIRSVLLANKYNLNNWDIAIKYRNRSRRLVEKAKEVNFDALFSEPLPDPGDQDIWDLHLLGEIYDLGHKALNGNELSEIAHSIAVENRDYEGLTPTDLELATVLLTLTKHLLRDGLKSYDVICDIASGSGNLLISAISVFHEISPSQLWANDKEALFIEPLAIRLGLAFPSIISPQCAPKITNKDIVEFSKNDFLDVKILVMNPPFVSGVSDQDQKTALAKRIQEVTGYYSKTNVGQVGLESLFLELMNEMLAEGTVFALILPKSVMTSLGKEAAEIRKYLIDDFGLEIIFNYPRDGIFSRVIKDTIVFLGIKGSKSREVSVINSALPVAQIENNKLLNYLDGKAESYYGVRIKKYERNYLKNIVDDQWREIILDGVKERLSMIFKGSYLYINENDLFSMKRGSVGNSGLSDLIFTNSNSSIWSELENIVPNDWLMPGIRTADDCENIFINEHTIKSRALCVPDNAFIFGTYEYGLLEQVIETYINLKQNKKGKKYSQAKKEKDKDQIRGILKIESTHITKPMTLLIPRGLRVAGRIFMVSERAMVSTNFIEISSKQKARKLALLTWLLSIFSQVQFEWLSKNQEGLRKLEIKNLKDKFLIPKSIEKTTDNYIDYYNDIVEKTQFLTFSNLQVQKNDIEWAKKIFHKNDIDEKLRSTLELTEELVHDRAP